MRYLRPGQLFNSTKYKIFYFLDLREKNGQFSPMSVSELAYWTGCNRRSLQTLVQKWRQPSWRRILRRTLPDGRFGYVLGSRGRLWVAESERFIPQNVRDTWLQEIIDYQQEMLAERQRWQASTKRTDSGCGAGGDGP